MPARGKDETAAQLRIGVHTPLQGAGVAELLDVWVTIERLGFDWISVWDHFTPVSVGGSNLEAVAMHAALAMATTRVEVGCLVYSAGYRSPAVLAAAASTIDHLSGGRAVLGLGAGYLEREYDSFGVPFEPAPARIDRLESTVRAVRALLTGDPVDHHDDYVTLSGAVIDPTPVRSPLPIWIGGGGEQRILPLAGRLADGWNVPMATLEDFTRKSAIVSDHAERSGRDPAAVARSVNLGLCWDETQIPERFGANWERLRPAILTGSTEQVLDAVGSYVMAGADWIILSMRPPIVADELERFASDILPALR